MEPIRLDLRRCAGSIDGILRQWPAVGNRQQTASRRANSFLDEAAEIFLKEEFIQHFSDFLAQMDNTTRLRSDTDAAGAYPNLL